MNRSLIAKVVSTSIVLALAVIVAWWSIGGGRDETTSPQHWNLADTGQPYTDIAFTVNQGTWMSVDVSSDGKTVVFDLLGDIYSMPAEGGEATLVHGGPAMQTKPRFGPDGSRILYLSDLSGSDNLWISDPDGGHARQVTHETTRVMTSPAWGPEGKYVAGARLFDTENRLNASEIRLYALAGGAGRPLVDAPKNGQNVHEEEFSPDGRYLYYTERVSRPHPSHVFVQANHRNFAIQRRDLATGKIESILEGYGGATSAEISPDSRRVAFVRRVKDKTVLFVYDTQTREQRPVYAGLDRDSQGEWIMQGTYYPPYGWYPDNQHVAIWAGGKLLKIDMDSGKTQNIPFTVHVKQRVTRPVRLSQELAPKEFAVRAIRQTALSPDGKSIVFNAIGHLWRMALPDGKPERVTNAAAFEFEPAFSPDGTRIAYIAWDDEKGGALKTRRLSDGAETVLAKGPEVFREPSFSADGTKIVYHIAPGDKCVGGYRGATGIYRIATTGGTPHRITDDGEHPHFSRTGSRVTFIRSEYKDEEVVSHLMSVDSGGLDLRTHATAQNADIHDIHLSPDGHWIAFRQQQQYYVMPYRETGKPLLLDAAAGTVPATRLTKNGGYSLRWQADSKQLSWLLGQALYHADVTDRVEADADSPAQTATLNLNVPADKPKGAIAFKNARIITMQGDKVIEHGTIVVDGNRIAAVGAADNVTIPDGAYVIDAAGKTIMPGLVDMHGHIDNCYYTSSGLMPQKAPSRYADLAFGVTTNYDPYTSELPTYSMAEMTMAGIMVGPRSVNVGAVMYGRKAKGDATYVPIRNLEDARQVMMRKRALGGTIIKSYRQPMRSQRQQLVKAGREFGVMVDVEGESHFYNDLSMIIDGHVCLEHNIPVATYYDDIVQFMSSAHAHNTPTLIVTFGELVGENYMYQTTQAWKDKKLSTYVQDTTSGYSPLTTPYAAPPYVRSMTSVHVARELWDIGFRSVARSVKKLDDAGVVINAGSHGQIAGIAMHWEMWLLAQGGMSNLHVLRAATLNGARTLALDKQIGSLKAGKLADLLVLDANPLEDIHNTNTVRYTMVNGRLYNADTMNEVGNYNRPRARFYWETPDYNGIDWNDAWAEQ